MGFISTMDHTIRSLSSGITDKAEKIKIKPVQSPREMVQTDKIIHNSLIKKSADEPAFSIMWMFRTFRAKNTSH